MLRHWEVICEQLQALTTSRPHSLSPITIPHCEEGVPCDICGMYFSSTKTMRQHRARKHQVLVHIDPAEEAQYQPHEHSVNGLPQCKHCNLKLYSASALKQHVLTYACRPRKKLAQADRSAAEPTARSEQVHVPAEERMQVVRLRLICVENRYHWRYSRTGPRSCSNTADSAITGSRRAARSKNALNECISAYGRPLWSNLMTAVSHTTV